MKHFYTIALLLLSINILSQNTYTIKGKVCDASGKEWLPGTIVEALHCPGRSAMADSLGNYTISLPAAKYTLEFRILGYKANQIHVTLDGNKDLDVFMEAESQSLSEIVISGRRKEHNVKNAIMGVERLNIETTSKIPALLGETDILKTLQLLPGVQSAGDGNIGFYVRGGAGDQNLILLDNATVYNPSHLFGFFSTFNADAIEDFTLYKGSIPAQYGGRLSSALDVSMRDGSLSEYKAGGGIGLISSRLLLECPIQKDRSSFIVAARRTYADVLAKAAGVAEVKGSTLFFYDLNAKLTYMLSKKDKLTLTAYHGEDKLALDNIVRFDWGNTVASLKWNHTINEKQISATSFSYTNYKYNVGVDLTTDLRIFSNIQDFNLSQLFSIYPDDRNNIKWGFSSIYRRVLPGELRSNNPERLRVIPFEHRYSWDNALYASHNIHLTERLELDYGLRLTSFSVLGGGNFYRYDSNRNVSDTIQTKQGEFVKTYWNIEPRASLVYLLTPNSSVKVGYTRSTQNLHLLSTANMVSPTDRWVASTNYIKPETSDQVAAGYFINLDNNTYELGAETYYKTMRNQIDYRDGAEIYDKDNTEPDLLFGKGRSYGLELFARKKRGRLSGWLSYTLSRTEKKINGINNDEWYAANQDRTHNISAVGILELNRKWTLSATWVYATGSPMTFPSGKYLIDDHVVYYYDGRNKSRASDYHRLDLGATCILKKTRRHLSELSFSLYNAYGQKNPYLYDFTQSVSEEGGLKSEVKMIYLFGVIPSVTWNFKF